MLAKMVSGILAVTIMIGAGMSASNQTAEAVTKFSGDTMTLEAAQRIIAASIKKSDAMGVKMNITVLDVGGNLKAFVRMDDAFLGSADISMKKAKTAVLFGAPSGALGTMTQPGGDLYGLERSNGGLITFAGGLPLKNAAGKLIGSIGVSGSSVQNDEMVATAGAAAL